MQIIYIVQKCVVVYGFLWFVYMLCMFQGEQFFGFSYGDSGYCKFDGFQDLIVWLDCW